MCPQILFHADNGEGRFETELLSRMKVKPGSKKQYFDLCNGKWHSVHAIKDRRTLQLSVDGIAAETVTDSGPGKLITVDTGDRPLHIGGIRGL